MQDEIFGNLGLNGVQLLLLYHINHVSHFSSQLAKLQETEADFTIDMNRETNLVGDDFTA